jgi:hypothetical protein
MVSRRILNHTRSGYCEGLKRDLDPISLGDKPGTPNLENLERRTWGADRLDEVSRDTCRPPFTMPRL